MVKLLKNLWMYFNYGMFYTIGYVTSWIFRTFFEIWYFIPCLRAILREVDKGIIDHEAIEKMSTKEGLCYLEKNSYAYRNYWNMVDYSSDKAHEFLKKILF